MNQEDVVNNEVPQKFKIPFVFFIVLLLAAMFISQLIENNEMAVVTVQKNGNAEFQLNDQKFKLSCEFENDEYYFFETNYPEVKHCWSGKNIKNGSEKGVCFHSGDCFEVVILAVGAESIKIKISKY